MTIRFARKEDAKEINRVYSEYIDTSITFEERMPTIEEQERRISRISAFYPYLVAEEEGRLLGYAYAHAYDERDAYDWTVELSIYLAHEALRRRVGTKLYQELFKMLEKMGVYNLVAIISRPNPESVAFHESLGFFNRGCVQDAGFKHDAWHDVMYFEKQIGSLSQNPAKPKSIKEVLAD